MGKECSSTNRAITGQSNNLFTEITEVGYLYEFFKPSRILEFGIVDNLNKYYSRYKKYVTEETFNKLVERATNRVKWLQEDTASKIDKVYTDLGEFEEDRRRFSSLEELNENTKRRVAMIRAMAPLEFLDWLY